MGGAMAGVSLSGLYKQGYVSLKEWTPFFDPKEMKEYYDQYPLNTLSIDVLGKYVACSLKSLL